MLRNTSVIENETDKIQQIIKKVRKIQNLSRINTSGKITGSYRSVFRGNGIEFDQVREYSDMDDSRLIDWKVTARFNHPYVKTFIEERDLKMTFMVDISGSNMFESANASKRDTAAEIFAAIGLKAVSEHDKISLILFSSKVEKYIPPSKGQKNFLKILRDILFFQPKQHDTGIAGAIEYYASVTKTPGVVILISDFFDTNFQTALRKAAYRHKFYLLNISDRLEENFPNMGLVEFFDPETGERVLADTSSKHWREAVSKNKAETRAQFLKLRGKNIYAYHIYSGDDITRDLGNFFRYAGAK